MTGSPVRDDSTAKGESMSFEGKTVLVTGGSAGIGREACRRFAERGAAVMINYASSEKDALETLSIIEKAGGKAAICRADVSREDQADRLVADTVAAFGRLDVLINNAGATKFVPYADLDALTADVWERIYQVNVMGTFFCSRAAAKEMRKTGGGVIVNNASLSGHRTVGSSIPYAVSKAGVLHLTRCLAVTLGPDVRVNSVTPGYITDTRWNKDRENYDADAVNAKTAAVTPMKRTGAAADIAAAMVFLASDEATFITGSDLRVDGGRYMTV